LVFGHLTVTAAGLDILRRTGRPLKALNVPLVLVGAYLPDLVDKPVNHLTGLSGRGYGHSLVVQAVAFGILWLLAPGWRKGTLSLFAGAAAHLPEDAVPARVLLAPLLGPVPAAPHWGFWDSLVHFYGGGGPLVWLEVLSLLYWLVIGVRRLGRRPEPA
jgi:hypothetical protein